MEGQEFCGEKARSVYMSKISRPIEAGDRIIKNSDGSFTESHFSIKGVVATGPINWSEAYDINQTGTHTSGRRGGLDALLEKGIEPFGTPINEGLTEVPAVVCGYLEEGNVIQDSETFRGNYGDIFNPESDGFVVVLGPEITETDGYEVVGPEARIKTIVSSGVVKAIIVGNEKMYITAVGELKKKGLTLPVIRMEKTDKTVLPPA